MSSAGAVDEVETPAQPSATVIALRSGGSPDALEVLLLRRNRKLAFHGGSWVFPGGRVDDADYPRGAVDPSEIDVAVRRAAVREAHEEAGIAVDPDRLVPVSQWTTPPRMPRRFRTWFFATDVGEVDVRIDGGEIHDHRWVRPATALEAQRAGELVLPPATYVTLLELAADSCVDTALERLRARTPHVFLPSTRKIEGGRLSLYQEDAAYPDGDPEHDGPRHRLWMLDAGWRYERG